MEPHSMEPLILRRHMLADLLTTEIETCVTFGDTAKLAYALGQYENAERATAATEDAYANVVHFLADPERSHRLTSATRQQLLGQLPRLQRILDDLHGLKHRDEMQFAVFAR